MWSASLETIRALIQQAITLAARGERSTAMSAALWDATVERTGPLRLVRGAQADMARQRGLTKINRDSAARVWAAGIPMVIVGSDVNDHHFFSGWSLATVPSAEALESQTFQQGVNAFEFYLEPELGRHASFFVFGLPPPPKARRRG